MYQDSFSENDKFSSLFISHKIKFIIIIIILFIYLFLYFIDFYY